MLLGAGIEPLVEFVCVTGVSSFVVSGCGPRNPGLSTGFMLVSTVWIAMADIVSMLGAVMRSFKPFVSVAILVNDPFVDAVVVVTRPHGGCCDGACCCN